VVHIYKLVLVAVSRKKKSGISSHVCCGYSNVTAAVSFGS